MTEPKRIEWIILCILLAIATAINIKNHGWSGLFQNTNALGYSVAAWIWCLVLHRK